MNFFRMFWIQWTKFEKNKWEWKMCFSSESIIRCNHLKRKYWFFSFVTEWKYTETSEWIRKRSTCKIITRTKLWSIMSHVQNSLTSRTLIRYSLLNMIEHIEGFTCRTNDFQWTLYFRGDEIRLTVDVTGWSSSNSNTMYGRWISLLNTFVTEFRWWNIVEQTFTTKTWL